MKNKIFDKFIIIFLLLDPIINVITSIQTYNNVTITIGTILKGILFLIIMFYLLKSKSNLKSIFIFIMYIILSILYTYLSKNNILRELINCFKIFYLPFMLYFFNKYENIKINEKILTIIYIIYLNLILIPYMFSIGNSSYSINEQKQGFIGLFYSGNEISAVILMLLPVALNYIINNKKILLRLVVIIETILVFILIGTKTLILGLLLIIIYFFKEYFIYSINKITVFCIIVFCLIFILVLPKLPVYNNLKIALNYYEINELKDIFSIESIDNIIFSKRLTYLKNNSKEFINEEKTKLIFGIKEDNRDVEIDIFDILFSVGILGFTIWIVLMIIAVKECNLKGIYRFTFYLMIIISLFSGHILIKPMVSTYLSTLTILNKNALKN